MNASHIISIDYFLSTEGGDDLSIYGLANIHLARVRHLFGTNMEMVFGDPPIRRLPIINEAGMKIANKN
jgi:hypothetical protein